MEKSLHLYQLGFENIKKIPFFKYDKDFMFIVDGKEYHTSRFLADFLSPIVCNLHYQDESIDSFEINTFNNSSVISESQDYFEDFLKLGNFDEIELTEAHKMHYLKYFLQLGNIDEFIKLEENISNKITIDEAIQHLNHLTQLGYQVTNYQNIISTNIDKILNYLSSHFYDIKEEKLLKISEEYLIEILKLDTLMISDEDSLLDQILYLYEHDHKYSNLFEFIYFERISSTMISKFFKQFQLNDMNIGIWESICHLFESTKSTNIPLSRYKNNEKQSKNPLKFNRGKIIEFEYENGEEFNGIIQYLTNESGCKNIHQNGIIAITSNSIDGSYHNPCNLVDSDDLKYYQSRGDPNSFVCFDFKDKQIQLANYSLKSDKFNASHLRNWKLEVSNDQNNWETVDSHSNDVSLNGNGNVVTFNTTQTSSFYRFVRLYQTGVSWSPYIKESISLAQIEFFGKLKF